MTKPKVEPKKHVHKLKRIRFKSNNTVYMCVEDCTFKISTPLAEGKTSICWRCGNEFRMDEYAIRLAKPHCPSCHKPKNGVSHTETNPAQAEETHPTNGSVEPFDFIQQDIALQTETLSDRLAREIREIDSISLIDEGDI